MGSHGEQLLNGSVKYCLIMELAEESMGVLIKTTMDTTQLDYLESGLPVYFDRVAYHADGIIAVNRVKFHTAFKGKIESGLHKTSAVGLRNHCSARLVHSLGVKKLCHYTVEFDKVI